ncbi:MAG: prepilin-type N-terminal cleavage/methylation domain-containing protein [Oligoflexia bacterium]|nr:prepilin-type N-terminal cleavage/methylation domain-containing protein [Oligoflexia bacterium]
MASTRISVLTRADFPRRGERGFSLIELIVVIALMSLISLFALPTVTSYLQVSLKSATRELASLIKETYNSSLVTGKVHRLVYDLKTSEYWVESGPPSLLLDTQESLEKEEQRKRLSTNREDEAPKASPFSLEKSITRKKLALPSGVSFEDIGTEQNKEPISQGKAYTHFFPHGITEQTIIHLTDQSKHRVTLVITPLIGRTDLYERYVTASEIFEKR